MATRAFMHLQNMTRLYQLSLAFIKVIKYAEEANVKGKKFVHYCQDML